MPTRIDSDWQYRGLQVVRLENDLLCVDVLPELGAKIWNFVHKPSGRNLLWHNPHLPPSRQPFGQHFDDVWCGGWDELAPNDVPTPVACGDTLPDHGEIWSQPQKWQVTEDGPGRVAATFASYGRVWPTRFEKTLSLAEGESCLHVQYQYTNLGPTAIDFLWNIHPALVISPATRLDVPARRGIVDPWSADQFTAGAEYTWPFAINRRGQTVDLRMVPPAGAQADFHYLPDVAAGWYAVTDTQARVGFGLAFPTAVFPHLWLFRPYGGWRGLYTVILEASTGYPNALAVARESGHCGHLGPGETLAAQVVAVAYAGCTAVKAIEPDGNVIRKE